MILDNVLLHHVTETKRRHDGGTHLLRIPEKVAHQLGDGGRRMAMESIGSEIRFVTSAPICHVTVGAFPGDSEVIVYRGPFQHSKVLVPAGQQKVLHLDTPGRLAGVKPDVLKGFAFSSEVWRVIFNRHAGVFYSVESFGHPVRPPTKDELPKKTWLAYGSSITHSNAYDGYPFQAARRMGVDLLNYGLSGSCHCEKAMADHIATRGGWDFCTMELGINMRGGFTPDQFRERAEYLIRTVAEKNPDKPIGVITHFPTDQTFASKLESYGETELKYEEHLRDIVHHIKHPQLRVIDGGDVLDRYDGHTVDLIHPGQLGHAAMGENLARILTEWLEPSK
jgi:lysophospholipase L1-like esterase